MMEETKSVAALGPPTIVDDRTARITDSKGRLIEVKRLSAVNMMKLYGAVGAEKSTIDRYMGFAALAASVAAIDNQPKPFPKSAGEVEYMVDKLDQAGLEAVAAALNALAPPAGEELAEAAENL